MPINIYQKKNLNVTKCQIILFPLPIDPTPFFFLIPCLIVNMLMLEKTFCCLHPMLVVVGGGWFFLWAQNCLHKTVPTLFYIVEQCLLSDHNSSFLRISFADFLADFLAGFLLATLSSFFSVFFFSSFCFGLSASLSYKMKENKIKRLFFFRVFKHKIPSVGFFFFWFGTYKISLYIL